ncbi:hypothetical protein C8Q76DRAFT_629548 [Earliella scabrosa]|nr:hypothetical protein C8Q76DRAFT_629548 [Earliella scabrosa]
MENANTEFDNVANAAIDGTPQKKARRQHPDEAAERLYAAWLSLLPSLVPDYLVYLRAAQRRIGGASVNEEFSCQRQTCMVEATSITCLYFDLKSGLFPTAPSLPRVAVSIDLLDFYFALFERSADAITALAGALKSLYQRRGFPILNEKGEPVQDPFRRGIGYAVQWYDCLRGKVENLVETAIDDSLSKIHSSKASQLSRDNIPSLRDQSGEIYTIEPCDRILQKRCPACFGGTRFGRNFDKQGGDVHVAIDATFSQRHNVAAGDNPWFHEPRYFIPKTQVDAVGDRIAAARKSPPRKYSSNVPDSAVDECEKSFEAADEKKAKTHGVKFDDTGLMALVCRHDIVLFLANVDSPGEQQKYGIALLEHFVSLLPPEATVAVFYDIGCVLDRSLHLYDILAPEIVERLVFATSVMHAYGHQWSCQLVYNPRLREGLGLTEGEGTERVWSKFRRLIGVTRTSGRSRRIWYLDRHADAINATAREELGNWHRSRLRNGVEARSAKADQELFQLQIPIPELREQWKLQRAAQLSLKNHAPARLKRELDKVLSLQTDLDEIAKHVASMQANIASPDINPQAHSCLESLKKSHGRTMDKVEALYASLNVPDEFPQLQGLPLPFVQTLLMARDLKINIRKRAIGSFFEWDKLDRAAGGRDQPLGTKLHQQTRKAISKRTPALLTAIRKFNGYCDNLKTLREKDCNIPLPTHLPTELGALREDPSLLTDVWIAPAKTDAPSPPWLEDANVRRGIRAMLAKDRCLEERRRLGDEADNLCRWYGNELAAVELALRTASFDHIAFLLEQRKAELLLLQARWRTPLASELRFASQTKEASRIAEALSGMAQPRPLHWVSFPIQDGQDGDDRPDPEDAYFEPSETVLAHDTISQLVEGDTSVDEALALPRQSRPAITNPDARRVLPRLDPTLRPIVFAPDDLDRLRQPEAWLNDDCINGCMELLAQHFGTDRVVGGDPAFLSSYAMASQRGGQSDDEQVWRVNHIARYWEKDVWLVPVHKWDGHHWELAIVYFRSCRIAYFDSFGMRTSWEDEAKTVFKLIFRLNRLAEERGYTPRSLEGEWAAYPLLKEPLQTNSYDCGVWILACASAILRGYQVVRISEQEISRFRSRLYTMCLLMTSSE